MPKIYIIIGLTLFATNHFLEAYPWPIEPFDVQHQITSTLGEPRPLNVNPPDRLHRGVDIVRYDGASVGISVYPVEDGRIMNTPEALSDPSVENGWIYFAEDKWIYKHIKRDPNLRPGTTVYQSTTLLGVIGAIDHPHLHLEEDLGVQNPLRVGGLTSSQGAVVDNVDPDVRNVRVIRPDDSYFPTQNSIPVVTGLIKIIARCQDYRILSNGGNGGGCTAPYKVYYQIKDNSGNIIYERTPQLFFFMVPPDQCTRFVYFLPEAYTSNPIFIVTNSFFRDEYYDTGPLSDGYYWVKVIAEDIRGNIGADSIQILVTNPPQVIFTDPSQGEENVDIYDFRKQKQKGIGDEFNFEVVFNKPMDTVSVCQAIKVVNVDKDSSPVLIKNIYWYDDRTILVRCYDSLVKDDTTGLQFNTNYAVKILGTAKDTSGATLDGNKNGKNVTLTPNNFQADLKFYTNYLNAWNFTNSDIDFCSNFYITL